MEQGLHRHAERHTVAELLARWMEHIEGLGRAPTTLARYRSAIRHDIVPRIGEFRIDRIQPADIDRFYTGRARSGLQPVSIIYVAVTTGCRRGELCGLRWSDVDFDASPFAAGVVEVKGTKTQSTASGASPLPPLAGQEVEHIRRCHLDGVLADHGEERLQIVSDRPQSSSGMLDVSPPALQTGMLNARPSLSLAWTIVSWQKSTNW